MNFRRILSLAAKTRSYTSKKDISDLQRFEEKLTELRQNEAVKRAKEVFAKAKEDVYKQNAAIIEDMQSKAKKIKDAVGSVASSVGGTVSKPVRQFGEKVAPYVPDISESKVVKKVAKSASEAEENFMESSNVYQYGGFKSREQREKTKGKFDKKEEPIAANEDATSVVMHKEGKWSNLVSSLKESKALSKLFGFKRNFEESQNIFVYFAREATNSIADKFSYLWSETETARALKEIQLRDPSFSLDTFNKYLVEHVMPELLDAILSGDLPTLRVWCSEAMYNMLKANFKEGHRMEGKVLDMRNLELVTAKVLDSTPCLVYSFHTQQISCVKDVKGDIVEGSDEKISNVVYIVALAKDEINTGPTQGWRVIELAIRDQSW